MQVEGKEERTKEMEKENKREIETHGQRKQYGIYVCKVRQREAVNEYSAVSILGGSV
jgi:hypothetical protein